MVFVSGSPLESFLASFCLLPLGLRKGSGGEVGFERDFSVAESYLDSRKWYHSLSKLKYGGAGGGWRRWLGYPGGRGVGGGKPII